MLNRMDKYLEYKSIDFLKDESFLKSRFLLSEEDVLFWDNFMTENPDKKTEIDFADEVLRSVKFNNETFSLDEKLSMLEEIYEKIKLQKQRKAHRRQQFAVAASISVIISLSISFFFMKENRFFEETTQLVQETTSVEDEKNIQLILSGEDPLVFEENADISYKQGGVVVVNSGNEKQTSVNVEKDKDKYNKLIVPKGKRSSLVLEDGSKVWINSGTKLEFPVVFADNYRELIVDGEIYIEVAKDKNRPFYVKTNVLDLKVLGTRFNISAYKDDAAQSVVLVEGSVEVQPKDNQGKTVLKPDQMLTMSKGSLEVTKVNTYDYISWKDGLLQFRSESLSVILSKLSRFYNTTIECEPDIRNLRCSGKLVLFDNMSDVLETISNTIPLEKTSSNTIPITYEIINNRVYIKKKQI